MKPKSAAGPVLRFLAWLACAALSGPTCAQLVVVANASSTTTNLNREDIINVFLGRYRQLPSGAAVLPIDLPADTAERTVFYRLLVHWEPAQMNSYWARLTFSGRTARPPEASGVEDLLARVAANRSAIGYLKRSQIDSRVKVVFELVP